MKRALIATAAGICVALFHSAAIGQKVDAEGAKSGAKQRGCLNCHDIDKKKVGPPFRDSSGKSRSAAELAAAIKAKPVHASALKQTSDKDLKLISEWILTLGK